MEAHAKILMMLGMFFIVPLYADQTHSEFEYQQALQKYEQLAYKNFAAWYNIGVLQEKLGNKAQAIVSFLRAEKQAGFTEFYKTIKLHDSFSQSYSHILQIFIYSVPLYIYQCILLALLCLCLVLWYGVIRYCKNKKYAYIVLFLCVAFYSLYMMKYNWLYTNYGVVIEQQVLCYAGPDTNFLVIDAIKASEVYKIYKEKKDFYQIKNNDKICWVMKKNLEKV